MKKKNSEENIKNQKNGEKSTELVKYQHINLKTSNNYRG